MIIKEQDRKMMYEYRGSSFQLEEIHSWPSRGTRYQITDIRTASPDLWIPDTYGGSQVEAWAMEEEKGQFKNRKSSFPDVRVLYISKGISEIFIRNDMFPNLERVEIDADNETFSTDGRLIFAKESRRYYGKKEKWLKYCPVCEGDVVVIPDDVKGISARAFYGTRYRQIQFPDAEIEIDSEAFEGSIWLEKGVYPIVIGDMLYKIDQKAECLEIPKSVRRFHANLFNWNSRTKKIISPFLPNLTVVSEINKAGCCRSLEITSAQTNINLRTLRKLETLEEVVITSGHKRYQTRDGVVFSADGKKLVYYPSSRKNTRYEIPDGVQKIEESAFASQKYLKELVMPDSVCTLGTRAFYDCKALDTVQLSSNIREIPDSNAYQKGGVFQGCQNLERIRLPWKLEYLGSYAFYRSGLKEITLNSDLQQIGEYALMAKGLTTIRIPESVKRLGKGSLFYVDHVHAYEGSAKGLISAVNTTEPDTKDKSANVVWTRFVITVLHRNSKQQEELLIPASLKRSAAYHLDMAWNSEPVDYEEYDECLDMISQSEEKLEFARRGILRQGAGENSPYTEFIRRMSYKIGAGFLEEGEEKEFLDFLKMDFLSADSLTKLLRLSNQKGMTVCSAYIMEMRNKKEQKKAGFRL
ncbi:MAG: leucine-rich repeat domain-containing protein [Clostridiales bacterium]|nr:leucine-rich repeat domain-containing protein [Clostridiales bacterium]